MSQPSDAGGKVVTQLYHARAGTITAAMQRVAEDEKLPADVVCREVAAGRLVIPANVGHESLVPRGVGWACRCKVNANIGNSTEGSDLAGELEKLNVVLEAGADAVMDLSTGGDIPRIRAAILERSPLPVGTVPIYEAMARAGDVDELTDDLLVDVIRGQAEQGVDFITIHVGLLREHLPLVQKRLLGIVSRGGSLTAAWMLRNGRENPLYERYDELLDICRRYDVTLSLGDALRPGCLADASDAAQFAELDVLGELTRRAWARDVQVMVEGPGHIPLHEVVMNVERQQEVCDGAPFYVLGPVVTDVGMGYDHIASAIGGAVAAQAGVSMLCYVTPMEHLGLPEAEHVREGIIAHRIAAHAADIARGRPGARDRDDAMSRARFDFDWERQFELALDPGKAREMRGDTRTAGDGDHDRFCSMCGPNYCAMKISQDLCGPEGPAHPPHKP